MLYAFNRTILELKLVKWLRQAQPEISFNRTILELKLIVDASTMVDEELLIVPYWN